MIKGFFNFYYFLFTILIVFGGCSYTTPSISASKKLKYIEFVTQNIETSSLFSIPIQATCFYQVDDLELSFDNGSTWILPASYDANAKSKCENGTFRITLTKNKAPLSSMTIAPGDTFQILIRGVLFNGDTTSTTVQIKYTPSTTISQEILAGSATQTGSGLILKGRARAIQQTVQTGTGIKVRGYIVK